LEEKAGEIAGKDSSGEMAQLLVEKEDLYTEYMQALDDNNLAQAQELSASLEEKEQQIQDLEEKILTEAGEQGTEYLAKAELAAQSVASNILEWKADALAVVAESVPTDAELENLTETLDSIGEIAEQNFQVAFPAIQEIHAAMVKERDVNGSDSFDACITQAEDLILENAEAYQEAAAEDIPASRLDDYVASWREEDKGLDPQEQEAAIVLAVLDFAQETGNEAAEEKGNELARMQEETDQPLICSIITELGEIYIPVTSVADCAEMRYLWNSGEKKATLARGSQYYTFLAFSDTVWIGREEEKTDQMPSAVKYKGILYLPETFVSEEFGLMAKAVTGTGYGILYSSDMEAAAQDWCTQLLKEAGG
jgi:hypothetical protein